MKNIKKYALIGALSVVAVIMVVLISSQLQKPSVSDDLSAKNTEQSDDVKVNPETSLPDPVESQAPTETEASKQELVINPIVTEKPTTGAPELQPSDYTGTEQKIQPDPVKPTEPPKPEPSANTDLTNPDKKPDDVKATTAPTKTPEPSTPKNGTTNDKGQIYIEGFGWVKNEGGGTTVIDSQIDPDHTSFDVMVGH